MTEENTETRERGRPSIYTPELRKELCSRLSEGRTLRSVCRDEDMPHRRTVEEWLMDLPNEENKGKPWIADDFMSHYTRARTVQADNIHDEIVDIADDSTNDYVERIKKTKGGEKKEILFDKEAVLRSRLRVDARLAWLSNTEPRKYGKNNAKVSTETLGKDGKPVDPPSDTGISRAITDALAKIKSGEFKDE